jgi:hypothetical protein
VPSIYSQPRTDGSATHLGEPECTDCGHSFDPDTSPDLDRCWLCSEHHAEVER